MMLLATAARNKSVVVVEVQEISDNNGVVDLKFTCVLL